MFNLKFFTFVLIMVLSVSFANAAKGSFSKNISNDSLRILKRMEYKAEIPNGLLHAISLVETNIGQTGKYLPWPYTIRLKRYKSNDIKDVDKIYDLLGILIDLGYKNFDMYIDGKANYSLSSNNIEEIIQVLDHFENIRISSRSSIKYFKDKKQAQNFVKNLVKYKWVDFEIGLMQLSYNTVKSEFENISDALDPYDNVSVMVKQITKIRQKYNWWEAVGLYHSKSASKAKRYVKNVWSMYQRVHKIKVR